MTSAGTPALFFSTRPINNNPSTILPNSVATAFWIAPEKLRGWHNAFYRPAEFSFGYKLALENNVVVTEPGGWAVLKLFSAWPHDCEPRFAVQGGHLYRRGHFGWLSEAGIVSHPETTRIYKAGAKESTTLRLSAVPAAASGHQLAVQAADPSGTAGLAATLLRGVVQRRLRERPTPLQLWQRAGRLVLRRRVVDEGTSLAGRGAGARAHGVASARSPACLPRQPADDCGHRIRAWAHPLRLQFGGARCGRRSLHR